MKLKSKFKRVDGENDRKLRFNGFCSKCNKNTDQRWDGNNENGYNEYRCMKCKTINEDNPFN